MVVRVAVNGIGTIGKRVAHAVKLQKDMKLVAICTRSPSPVIKTVLEPKGPLYGTDLYASDKEHFQKMKEAGMIVNGTLEDMLGRGDIDVIIDCTPAGIGEKNKKIYEKFKVKQIYQGGEKASVADVSFVAVANYEKAIGVNSVRVVSCNTTSLVRTLWTINENFGIKEAFAALTRRAADPWEDSKGPINAIVPDLKVPSHHAPDVKTVMPDLNIMSLAVKVPTTLAHVHMVKIKVNKKVSKEDVINAFEKATRIILLSGKEGYSSTARIIEKFRDLCRPRYDMYEVAIWKETVDVRNSNVYWIHMVHQEAIVIPENIDAIRAITGEVTDKWKSIELTNKSLGIIK